MRVSYRWLLREAGLTPAELPLAAALGRLTSAGMEVEGVVDLGAGSGKVVTAKILTREPHPNAERLSLCDVDAGGDKPLRIVCGAKNMGPGDRVPLALIGAALPNGITIKASKIRGEASEGMMCSPGELDWSDDKDGLLILATESDENDLYPKGEPFDAIIDLKVTPNRPDCLSIAGLARELRAASVPETGAVTEKKGSAARIEIGKLNEAGVAASDSASVQLDAPDACPRYLGRVVRGVKIAPSPLWLRRAVESAGLRSISNVVDVTNYILLELGQPLHAFDLEKVARHKIVIRRASAGESATTLDGQEITLTEQDLLIADPEKPIAIAGIMGCANTEISDATTNVFLECAYFAPSVVRRTAKRLGKSTDSSYRFERGVDPENLENVVNRAAALIVQVAGGEVAGGIIAEGPGVPARPPIRLQLDRVSTLLGLNLNASEVERALVSLGFGVTGVNGSGAAFDVLAPGFRPDIAREADLVEEIARVIGYDRIPETLPHVESRARRSSPEAIAAERVRMAFSGAGLLEVTNYSFLAPEALAPLGYPTTAENGALLLRNPLSAEYSVMRPALALIGGTAAALMTGRIVSGELLRRRSQRRLYNPHSRLTQIAGLVHERKVVRGWPPVQRSVDMRTHVGGEADFRVRSVAILISAYNSGSVARNSVPRRWR